MGERWVARVFRGVLRLLPRTAREYRREIEALAEARRRDLGQGARRRRVVAFWMREITAAARAVAIAWTDGVVARGRGGERRDIPWTGGGTMIGETVQDLKLVWRGARRSPAIPLAVTTTLAVGIGATLAILAIVDGVLLRPIPVPEPERVVRVFEATSATAPHGDTSYPMLQDYRDAAAGFEGPAGFTTLDLAFRAGEHTDHLSAGLVTGDFFEVLRVRAELGRTLQPSDDRPEAPPVVVLGHGLWTRLFGGDPAAVGRTIEISRAPFEIVGVAPAGFRGVTLEQAPELWIPMARVREAAGEGLFAAPNILDTRAFPWISMVARLPGAGTAAELEDRLEATADGARDELGDASGLTDVERQVTVRPLVASAVLSDRIELVRFVALLGAVVLLTLVVACANAANLLSARTAARMRELGVRQALGAGRARLVRHLLAESLALALVGAAAGLALAALALQALGGFSLPGGVPLERVHAGLDARTVLAALALAAGSAAAFGLAPALAASRRDIAARVRGGAAFGRRRGAPVLLALQVGISVVLTVGALLFGRTLGAALGTDLGFEPEGLAAASVAFRGHGYGPVEVVEAVERLLAEIEATPDVEAAAVAAHVPLSPSAFRLRPVPEGADEARGVVHFNVVTPGYFAALGIPLVSGRTFDAGDADDTPDVALLNHAAAELLWPGEDPLGRTFLPLRGLPPTTVVGVVEDHRVHAVAEEPVPYAYRAAAQDPQLLAARAHVVARGSAGAGAAGALAVVRDRLRAFDARLPVQDARQVEDQIARVLMPQRFGGLLLGLLAAVSLVVSAIGIYGMVTFAVRRRTREIGIRMALGAGPRSVVASTVAGAGAAVAAGVGGGLLLAGGLSRFVEAYLFGISRLDLPSFVGGALVLSAAALVAAVVPARRAVAVDPRAAIGDDG